MMWRGDDVYIPLGLIRSPHFPDPGPRTILHPYPNIVALFPDNPSSLNLFSRPHNLTPLLSLCNKSHSPFLFLANMAGGKAGKDAKKKEQNMSRSMRAGLQFPVGRIHRYIPY